MLKNLTFLCTLFLFVGCSDFNMAVTPQAVSISSTSKTVIGNLKYDGNTEYLPSSVKHDENAKLKVHYTYDVRYINGNTDYDALNLFNPLVLVGFKLSEETVIVDAKLEIEQPLQKPLVYSSSCVATKARTLYQTNGTSDMRRSCLIATRDSIQSQIQNSN